MYKDKNCPHKGISGGVIMRKLAADRPKREPTISVFYNEQWVPFETIPEEVQQRVRQRVVDIWQTATQQQIKIIQERARANT